MRSIDRIPLLAQIFTTDEERPSITLGSLAQSLNVPLDRLKPLVGNGWLKARQANTISSQTMIEAPSEAALKWLRQWFQPAQAKPLFSQQDMADLLGLRIGEVLAAAAAHNIPVIYDPALGHLWSMWSAKQMLAKMTETGRSHSQRFDRQALLWQLMDGDPQRKPSLPTFDESLEEEIERVAQMSEPMRSIRSANLLDQFRDAEIIVRSGEHSPCVPSQPESPDAESSASASPQPSSVYEQRLSRLRAS